MGAVARSVAKRLGMQAAQSLTLHRAHSFLEILSSEYIYGHSSSFADTKRAFFVNGDRLVSCFLEAYQGLWITDHA